MTQFEIATEQLYSIFSKYPIKTKIDGCPCCVSDSDKGTLHSKKLRELENDDLSYFAFKAMTTFGDLEDFKHFLPRIFELSAKRKLIVDLFVILGKLEYGEWINWNEKEKQAIKSFIRAWWKYDINTADYFDPEILIELKKFGNDISLMLKDWNLDIESSGFKNYVDLVENGYYDLKTKNRTFKELNEKELETFISWIELNSIKLEEAFFKYEKTNKEFSERISNTLYMFDGIQ